MCFHTVTSQGKKTSEMIINLSTGLLLVGPGWLARRFQSKGASALHSLEFFFWGLHGHGILGQLVFL